jgi:hypothetical protein
LDSCPKCDLEFIRGEGYHDVEACKADYPDFEVAHTKVRQRLIKADPTVLIHMAKHHLGQTERSLVEINGDKRHPLAFKNLTEEQIDRKLRAILPFLEKQYGKSPQVVEIEPPN